MLKYTLLIGVLAGGCVGTDPFTEYRNANNGEQANLNFFASSPAALGDETPVIVGRAEEGPYNCATYATPLSYGGSPSSVQCHFAGKLSPVEAVLEAQCDQGGCTTAISNGTALSVTGQKEGTFTLTVTARLADGTVLTDSTKVTWVPIDAIGLSCSRAYACPGPHAVFVGSTFEWEATPMSNGGPATGIVTVTVD